MKMTVQITAADNGFIVTGKDGDYTELGTLIASSHDDVGKQVKTLMRGFFTERPTQDEERG